MTWKLVVAMASGGVIGRDGDLPWRLSSDLRRFKQLTMGHCLVMGRKTMDSIGRPLPGRQTIVLSRSGYESEHLISVADSLDKVDQLVEANRDVMIVGGAEIYALAIPRCDEMFITRVLAEITGDTFFPRYDQSDWRCESREPFPRTDRDEFPTEFEHWVRIK